MLTVHNTCERVILKENTARDNIERKHIHLYSELHRTYSEVRIGSKTLYRTESFLTTNSLKKHIHTGKFQLKISKAVSSDKKASDKTISGKMVSDKLT